MERGAGRELGGNVAAEELELFAGRREDRDRVLVRQAASLLAADLSLGELFERLCEVLADYVDASVVFIALVQPDGAHAVEYFHDHGTSKRAPHIPPIEGSRSLQVIRSGKTIWGNRPQEWVGDGERIPLNVDQPETDDTVSAMFVPLRTGANVIGVLSVQTTQEDAYDQSEVELIEAIAHYLAVAVENQRMYRTLLRTADYDPLTGLVSHSRLLRELDSIISLTTSSRPAAAIILNVMNFAMFNETYGYAEGDTVLRKIAATLNEFSAHVQSIGRFGGDVFMLLLAPQAKEQSLDFIEKIAERCRRLSYMGYSQAIPISLACNLDLGYADLSKILQASLLHDVGKLLISDRILVKPSRLTPGEYQAIQRHAEFGKNLLAQYKTFAEVAEIVGQHHERWDGFGYPSALKTESIHPLARAR